MKKAVIALFALVAFAGTAFAAPEVIEMKKGVKFGHKAHVAAVGNCKKCHETKPGKIEGFGKDWAHKNCKGCHAEGKKGPTSCKECHK
ncbi:cytochrome c3 family protein [Geobacter sp. FeAm09]|uniref:cytochrome c3 family protein n=1 Tax=Geobacter sp. FeAm09 TaxID=2597769 RepID=UPI0011EDA4A0|nr:cytochrome c3 family protein [Geobacter sp. FeAm09]QEM67398.1 cytochrome c3 family protein [Geobacter sp. FeAm09]